MPSLRDWNTWSGERRPSTLSELATRDLNKFKFENRTEELRQNIQDHIVRNIANNKHYVEVLNEYIPVVNFDDENDIVITWEKSIEPPGE